MIHEYDIDEGAIKEGLKMGFQEIRDFHMPESVEESKEFAMIRKTIEWLVGLPKK